MVKYIANLVKYFNVGKSMNDSQVAETAKLILQNYYYLKPEDFKVCFDGMKSGKYLDGGKLFDRLDGQIIMLGIYAYSEERITVSEQINNEKHKELTEPDGKIFIIKVGANFVREAGDVFEEVDKKELATCFSFGTAFKLKEWLIKDYYLTNPKAVKILDSTVKGEGLFDYLEHNKPELLPETEKYKRSAQKNEYFTRKREILADESLNPFQKENALRALAQMEPLTIEEYNLQQQVYAGQIQLTKP